MGHEYRGERDPGTSRRNRKGEERQGREWEKMNNNNELCMKIPY